MQHFTNPWIIIMFVLVAVVTRDPYVVLLVLGVELTAQSLHESRHHTDGRFASVWFRVVGLIIVLIASLLLKI